jgi:hypothetical protein
MTKEHHGTFIVWPLQEEKQWPYIIKYIYSAAEGGQHAWASPDPATFKGSNVSVDMDHIPAAITAYKAFKAKSQVEKERVPQPPEVRG